MPLFWCHQFGGFLLRLFLMHESSSRYFTKVKTCSSASKVRSGPKVNLILSLLSQKLPRRSAFTSVSLANAVLLSKLGICMGLHSSRFVLRDQGGVSTRAVFLYPPMHHPPFLPPSLPPYHFLHTVSSQAFLWYLYFPPSTRCAHTDLRFSSA